MFGNGNGSSVAEVEPFGGSAYDPNGGTVTDQIVGGGRALQQVKSTYCTAVAVQKPRNIAKVSRSLLDEARLAGEDFYYGWGAGKDTIEGPSHDLAVAAARCWGNCATEMLPMQETADAWIFTAAFIDLETGYTRTRQFRQSKGWKVYGKLDDDRKADIRFQIGQSKAERNVILKALPPSLIREAMKQAKAGVKNKIEDFISKNGIAAAIDMVLTALAKQGAKEPLVLEKMGRADKKGLTVDDLVILRGDLSALENGQDRVESLFPVKEAKPGNPLPAQGRHNLRQPKEKPAPKPEAKVEDFVEPEQEDTPLEPTQPEPTKEQVESEMALKDLVDDLQERIETVESEYDLQKVGGDLEANKGTLGGFYAPMKARIQERFRLFKKK